MSSSVKGCERKKFIKSTQFSQYPQFSQDQWEQIPAFDFPAKALGFVGLPDSSSFDPLRQSIERLADRLFISPPIVHFPTDRTARYFQNSVEIPNSILNEVLSGRLPALETLRNIFVPGLKEPYVLLVPPWGNYRAFLDWMNQLQKEENMKLRELQELGHDTSDHNTYQSPKLIAVKRAWSEFFSDSLTNFIVKEYNVYGVSHLYLSCRKHGMEITDMQLSGGEKAILALVGSLAQSYQNDAILLNNSGNPFEKYGIVLIDEIDLHLHPQWQRMILPKLMEVFPNTQFIVTTHSPQILGELRSENVFILTDGENGIEVKRPAYEIFGQTSGILLEDMMQTPERNVPVQEKIDEIFLSIEHGELEEAQKGYTELKSLAADLPEFVKIDMRLGRKEVGK